MTNLFDLFDSLTVLLLRVLVEIVHRLRSAFMRIQIFKLFKMFLSHSAKTESYRDERMTDTETKDDLRPSKNLKNVD